MFQQGAQFQPPSPGPTLITNFQQLRDHVLGFQANYNQYLLQFMQNIVNTQNGLQDFSLQPISTASGGTVETSASFDGKTGYISVPLVTTATTNVTLEAIVLLSSTPHGAFIKIGQSGTGYTFGVAAKGTSVGVSTPGPYLQASYGGVANLYPSGNPFLSLGTWHYVAMVIHGAASAPTFYLDTNTFPGTATSTPIAPVGVANIGGGPGTLSTLDFNGSLARVAVYTSALTATQIAAHYAAFGNDANYDAAVLADSPVGFWKLADAAGPTAVDSSGNGNDGTAHGGVSFAQGTPFGDAITPTNYMHVVAGNSTINTINPATGFSGQVALIAQDGFSLGTSGNIAQPKTVQPNQVVTLQYHPVEQQWYPNTTITNLQDVPDNPSTGTFSTGYSSTSGTNNFTGTLGPPAPPNQAAMVGKTLAVVFPNDNTGACTLNLNAFGAQPIVKNHTQPLIAGDIRAGQLSHILWNGTNYELQAPNGPTHRDVWAGTTSGTGLYTGTVGWNPTSNADLTGIPVSVKFGSSNTGANPGLSINSLAGATIVKADGTTIQAGNIVAGTTATVIFDGTNYRLQGAISSITGGGLTIRDYIQFQNGLIIQWGTIFVTTTAGTFLPTAVTLPLPWPNALLEGVATADASPQFAGINALSTTQITITTWNTTAINQTDNISWIAIGH